MIFKFSDCFGGQIEHKAYNLAHLILFTVGGGEDTDEQKVLKIKRHY